MPVILRKNRRFCINQQHIKEEHRTSSVLNGLYAAIYDEFRGAATNKKYVNLTYENRMQEVNNFAENWLKKRGFYNG